MNICVDLHSHSGYAGGVGDILLEDIYQTMRYKGIDVFGTGDCLLPARVTELQSLLKYEKNGLYKLNAQDDRYFLLQTEIILTVALTGYKQKIMAHHIILFPDFQSIYQVQTLFTLWGQKNTIGRPFIVCKSQSELEERLFAIQNIHPEIEIIPAHILTPDGLMGSKNLLHSITEFYGDFTPNIHAIETGLSADPYMLSFIPELQILSMLSFSDCHSSALNRVGREFTILESEFSYSTIIKSIRDQKIVLTAEFNPDQGRYHLTGHRADKQGHDKAIYYLENTPDDLICPICQKKMTMGVKDRWDTIKSSQQILPKNFVNLIPLIEVLAIANNKKSITSPKIESSYHQVIKAFDTEINLWQSNENDIMNNLCSVLSKNEIDYILAIKNGSFVYNPPGYDGEYGKLEIIL